MRAAIYSRFSTDRQNETSIEDQVRVATDYAAKHGLTIAARYTDEGISGTALGNRPGIQSVIEGAVAKAFDVLLVRDIQRIARGEDLPPLIKRLKFRNVRVVGVLDGFDSDAEGARLRTGMEGMMGAEYIETGRRLTHSGLKMRAGNGHHTGGSAYGYTTVPDGRYFKRAVVAEQADIEREVFARYAGGESQRAIATDLNRRGIASPRGKQWVVGAVHSVLRNDRYIGRQTWNTSEWRKDPDTGKRVRIERPESERVVTQQEDLRIVSDEAWARVRARDTPATYGSHNARPKYPLSGLLVCGECGRPLTLSGGKNARGFGTQRYVCSIYRHHGSTQGYGCSNDMGLSRAVAEELLIEPLRERLLNDQNFLTAISALKNRSLVSEPNGARPNAISGDRSTGGSDRWLYGAEGDAFSLPRSTPSRLLLRSVQ
jgi:DNA invertase Pin-like site-specific DNA recombinase